MQIVKNFKIQTQLDQLEVMQSNYDIYQTKDIFPFPKRMVMQTKGIICRNPKSKLEKNHFSGDCSEHALKRAVSFSADL